MEPERFQDISERDQLWASLRRLRPELVRLASGEINSSEQQRQLIVLLARIVTAELEFREQETKPA